MRVGWSYLFIENHTILAMTMEMAFSKVLNLLIAAFVFSRGVAAITLSPNVTFGEFTDLIYSGLFEIPGSVFGLGYNAAGIAAGQLVDLPPCVPDVDEDEDACRNITEMIRSRGFDVENYEVTSEDGYIMSVQRVINPLVDPEYRPKLKPVILQHGVLSSAVDWIFNSQYARPTPWPPGRESKDSDSEQTPIVGADGLGPEAEEDRKHPRSLAFYLANRGYDVFLPNSRGSKYSLKHVSKTILDPSYWDFTWDEQIDYDMPAIIKFVQETTGYPKIAFVGWSQGSTMMFGLLADRPEYADIIEPFVAFAPIAYIYHTNTPVKALLPLLPALQDFNMGFSFSDAFRYNLKQVCGPTHAQHLACLSLANQLYGDNSEGFDLHRIRTLTHHFPAGSSFKDVIHYAQEIRSEKFCRYNRGVLGNQQAYGSILPPEYNLTNVRSESMVFFHANNDYLAAPEDVELLVSQLGVKPMKIINMSEDDPKWNHMAYVYHKKAGILVNPRVTEILDQFNKQQ